MVMMKMRERCMCQVERTEKNCLSSEPASVRLTHEMRKEKKSNG